MFSTSLIFVVLPANSSSPLASLCPLLNESMASVDKCEASYVRQAHAFLPISLLALIINAASFLHFARPRRRRRSLMSLNLALLSFSEVLLHVSLTADYIGLLTGVCRYPFEAFSRRSQLLIAGTASLLADAFLCTRNWCHVIISSARAEVVLRPLRTRTCLTRGFTLRAYSTLLIVALAASAVRGFAEQLLICQGPHGDAMAALVDLWLSAWLFRAFESYVFFALQTLGPVLLVCTFSLLIAAKILPWYRSGDAQRLQEGVSIAQDSGSVFSTGKQPAATAARRRNHARATRTVLLLAAIFAAMEMPTVVSVLMARTTAWLDGPTAKLAATAICEAAILVDSVLNLVVFSTGEAPSCRRHREKKAVVGGRELGRRQAAKGRHPRSWNVPLAKVGEEQ